MRFFLAFLQIVFYYLILFISLNRFVLHVNNMKNAHHIFQEPKVASLHYLFRLINSPKPNDIQLVAQNRRDSVYAWLVT